MAADVQSIATLREWAAALAVYQSDLADSLSGVHQEIRRGIDWVGEQQGLWQRAVRDCQDEVVQAKSELTRKKFPGWDGRPPDTTVEERNLRRAQARLQHAEEQVQKCRGWLTKLPKLVEEAFTGPGHRLATFLDGDLARGLAVLGRQVDALDRYAELKADFSSAPSAAPPGPPAANPGGTP